MLQRREAYVIGCILGEGQVCKELVHNKIWA